MNDRELLELAAKAAGIRHIQPTDDYDGSLGLILCDEYNRPGRDWNPITDDGDALRLAVTLKINIEQWDSGAAAVPRGKPLMVAVEKYCDNGEDPCAATRRAITRAAAAIGQQMREGKA